MHDKYLLSVFFVCSTSIIEKYAKICIFLFQKKNKTRQSLKNIFAVSMFIH